MNLRSLLAVARHPSLWATALVQAWRLVPRRWWARRPFLPVPDRAYLRFRMETQYGGAGDHPIEAADLLGWLAWAKAFDRTRRPGAGAHR